MTQEVEGNLTQLVTQQDSRLAQATGMPAPCYLERLGWVVGMIAIGKRNNQNFVQIPHARFIDMLTYKASLVGIQVEIQEESYTSKASFFDLDPIPTYKANDETVYIFSGKRLGRRNRLYRTKDGRVICADVNGSYNILRKRKPDAFKAEGLAAYVVQPLRLAITV